MYKDIRRMPEMSRYAMRQAMSTGITSMFRMKRDALGIKIWHGHALTQQPPSRRHAGSEVRCYRCDSGHRALSLVDAAASSVLECRLELASSASAECEMSCQLAALL